MLKITESAAKPSFDLALLHSIMKAGIEVILVIGNKPKVLKKLRTLLKILVAAVKMVEDVLAEVDVKPATK